MNQLLFGLMRSDGNTLDWKLITSSFITFLIEVVKSLLSALAFVPKPKKSFFFFTKTCSSNSNFPIVYALINQRNDIKIFKMHMQSFAS